ncbi:MAG: hypothetical protein WBP91_11620, partial [Terriglobales bacterium]
LKGGAFFGTAAGALDFGTGGCSMPCPGVKAYNYLQPDASQSKMVASLVTWWRRAEPTPHPLNSLARASLKL